MPSSIETWTGDDDLSRQRRKRAARLLDGEVPDFPGLERYATRSLRGSKRAAERVLRDMVSAAEAGVTHRAGATFGELSETWLAHASGHLAANTVTETRRILDRVLLPRLGDVALAGLRPEHLDALYADLLCS